MTAALAGVALIEPNLEDNLAAMVDAYRSKIRYHRRRNQISSLYYDGKVQVQKLNVAISPEFNAIQTAIGWPTTVVDILEERCAIDYVDVPSSPELADMLTSAWDANDMDTEAPMARTAASIQGVTFVLVAGGDDGPLILPISADRMTGEYDTRKRSLVNAVSIDEVRKGDPQHSTIYLPNETIEVERVAGKWQVQDRHRNPSGIMPVERLVNRPRLDANAHWGRSSITTAIRSVTDSTIRTLLATEVAREFFAMPFRFALNADPSPFKDKDGEWLPLFETYWGRLAVLTGVEIEGEDGSVKTATPEFGQLPAQSPAGLVELVKMGSQLISAETGYPPSLFGFVSEQPPSGDAARMYENRLVQRSRQRIRSDAGHMRRVGKLVLIASGVRPESVPPISVQYFRPETFQLAATSDAMAKQTAGDNPIVPPESDVVLERLDYSREEVLRIETARRRRRADQTLNSALAAGATAAQNPRVAAALARSDAAGA